MKVRDLMTEKVTTLGPDDKMDQAFYHLNFERIRHLPVVEKGRVVGMISDRDIKKFLGSLTSSPPHIKNEERSRTIKTRKVRTMMKRGIVTISPAAEAAEAASIMIKRKIGALPVVQEGKLAGIITTTDILRGFIKLSSGRP
jgi:acetoin utilization protein AcuB